MGLLGLFYVQIQTMRVRSFKYITDLLTLLLYSRQQYT